MNWENVVMPEKNKSLEAMYSAKYEFRFFHMGKWEPYKIKKNIPYQNERPLATQSSDKKVKFEFLSLPFVSNSNYLSKTLRT